MVALPKVVVVGGGYAGVLAAGRIARGGRAQVRLVNPRPDFIERIRLHQIAAGQPRKTWPLQALVPRSVEVKLGSVNEIEDRVVRLADGSALQADVVVLAAGSTGATALPGLKDFGFTLSSLEDAERLRARCARGGTLAVIGGGLTGLEAATELARVHQTSLWCRGALGDGLFEPRAEAHLRARLAALHVEVHERVSVSAVEPGVLMTSAGPVKADIILLAGGFRASSLAASLGLPCDALGRLLVRETLVVPQREWLFGAGDAVVPVGNVGAELHMSCKTAMVMARQTADNVLSVLEGREPAPLRFGDTGLCVSLGRGDGLIQRRAPDGRPTDSIRGRAGAFIKEVVCRSTIASLRFPVLQGALATYDTRGRAALSGQVALLDE